MYNNKIDYNLLKVFQKVLETGSFTKAAKALRQPKSRVSRGITRLESQLGVELIRRTTRRVSATSIGRDFLKNLSPLLSSLSAELINVNNYQKEMTGTLRITAPQDLAQTVVAKIISSFNNKHPNIQIQSIITNELLDLTKENIDLSFRAGKLSNSNLIQKKLMYVNFIFVASKKYLDTNGYPSKFSDLSNFKYLSFKNMENLWLKNRLVSKPFLKTDSIPMLLNMALNSDGITMLPDYFCRDNLDSGKLIKVFPNWKSPTETIHILYHRSKNSSNIVRKFIENASYFKN